MWVCGVRNVGCVWGVCGVRDVGCTGVGVWSEECRVCVG